MRKLAILVILGVFVAFALLIYMIPTKSNPIDELYSKTSPSFKNILLDRTAAVSCNPNTYTENGNVVCVTCGSFSACFSTATVNIGGRQELNFLGRYYLSGSYDKLTELNFYTLGFAKFLGCNSSLVCKDGIIAKIQKSESSQITAEFTFQNPTDAIDYLKKFNQNCIIRDIGDATKSITTFDCDHQLDGYILNNSLVIIFL